MKSENVDVVVIGAGPAGCVAASYLSNNGLKVKIVEKQVFPRFVIGESLLPHCMDHLEGTGLLDAIKDVGFQIKTGASFYREDSSCQFTFEEQFTSGWSWTWQVQRAKFDQLIAEATASKGVDINFGCSVTAVDCDNKNKSVLYETTDGEKHEISCRFVIDASGYGRVLPRLFALDKPPTSEPRGAVFCHLNDRNRTVHAGENIFVHAFENNKAWLWAIPFSDKTTSVGIVGEDALIKDLADNDGKKFIELYQNFAGLNGRFSGIEPNFTPKNIMGYSVGVKKMYGNGYVLCGNSTEFLDPIFSSGVTLATASGYQAASLVLKELNGEAVDWEQDYEKRMQYGINVFRSYVKAWYTGELQTIFFAKNIDPNFKKQICSVLAGYVWDKSNPFVKKHAKILTTLAKVIKLNEGVKV